MAPVPTGVATPAGAGGDVAPDDPPNPAPEVPLVGTGESVTDVTPLESDVALE